MTTKKRKTNAGEAVKAIIEDLKDRRGLGSEWNQISWDVQQEIQAKWVGLVKAADSPLDAPMVGAASSIVGFGCTCTVSPGALCPVCHAGIHR